jgi:hypothetical protein
MACAWIGVAESKTVRLLHAGMSAPSMTTQ